MALFRLLCGGRGRISQHVFSVCRQAQAEYVFSLGWWVRFLRLPAGPVSIGRMLFGVIDDYV